MSLGITIASVAVIAAGVTLTVNQLRVNRVMADKSKMMQETAELAQKRAEEAVNREETREEKRARQDAEIEKYLADVVQECQERSAKRKAFLEGYKKQRSEPWSA